MFDLMLIHREGPKDLQKSFPEALVWQTCLRQIAFVPATAGDLNLDSGDQCLRGVKAFEFLVQVVSGLRSPILAETEVQGQFKRFLDEVERFSHPERCHVLQLGSDLLKHAKAIRTQYLVGMGSRSYGSLVRHYCKGHKHISILGAGHLAQQMLPLLAKHSRVDVICRNVDKAKREMRRTKDTRFYTLQEQLPAYDGEPVGLAIAAPLKASVIKEWIRSSGRNYAAIIDLRKDSDADSLNAGEADGFPPVIALERLFQEISENSDLLDWRIQEAKDEIAKVARKRQQRETCRPFGWEDLCA